MPDPTPDEPFDRGHVVWHDGLFGSGRPWFVVTDDRHPFYGEEYVVAGLTTTERSKAIEVTGDEWEVGGLPQTSYVSPWFLTTLKHADVDRGVGQLTGTTVETIVSEVLHYLGPRPESGTP